jgi:hypothetical protein
LATKAQSLFKKNKLKIACKELKAQSLLKETVEKKA